MADRTAIEWTDATWTIVTGCSKVSPGCAHCYAEKLATTRLAGRHGYTALPWTPDNAAANVVLHPERLMQPLRWREPRRIFVTSMGDLFHEQVPDDFIDQVFAVMAEAPRHTFQLLTKRPERMRAYLTDPETTTRIEVERLALLLVRRGRMVPIDWPLPNVWLGTSVENQTWADRRIPELLATPAAVRFLSCEPLLGPVNLDAGLAIGWQCSGCRRYYSGRLKRTCPGCGRFGYWSGSHAFNRPHSQTGSGIDWVIAGGESGPDNRPLDLDWARSLRDQCQAAGVPFFFKQVGGRTPKSGGRELDGRTWDEFPAVAA